MSKEDKETLYFLSYGFMVGVALCIAIYSIFSSHERWQDSCVVSETLSSDGVQVQCQFGNRQVILVSQRGEYLALAGNTPREQRSEIPTVCRHNSRIWFGRWNCRIGENADTFYLFTLVHLPTPAEEP